MFAGLQSLTTQQEGSKSSASEYIPRDDITEAMRMRAFGSTGFGEAIFDGDDPELEEAIREMVAGGQVDFGGEI